MIYIIIIDNNKILHLLPLKWHGGDLVYHYGLAKSAKLFFPPSSFVAKEEAIGFSNGS